MAIFKPFFGVCFVSKILIIINNFEKDQYICNNLQSQSTFSRNKITFIKKRRQLSRHADHSQFFKALHVAFSRANEWLSNWVCRHTNSVYKSPEWYLLTSYRICLTCIESILVQSKNLNPKALLHVSCAKLINKCVPIALDYLIWVNNSSGNVTKQLSEPMLTSYQWCSMKLTWEQFHREYPLISLKNRIYKITATSPCAQLINWPERGIILMIFIHSSFICDIRWIIHQCINYMDKLIKRGNIFVTPV